MTYGIHATHVAWVRGGPRIRHMRKQRTRLSLWQAGNTLCPICLLEFSREDATAENGRASIEHVRH